MVDNNILVNTGFLVGSESPIDGKSKVQTLADRDQLVTDGLAYESLRTYVVNEKKWYEFDGTDWKEVSEGSGSGVLEAKLTFTKDVGYVSAGTVYGAGTKIEDILREMVYKQPTDGLLTYYGYFDCDATGTVVTNPTVDDVKALNSEVIGTKEFTFNIDDMAYGQIAYAYPASFGNLRKITVNGMINYLNSCTKVDMIIDGINYVLYFLTDPCGGLVDIPIECA